MRTGKQAREKRNLPRPGGDIEVPIYPPPPPSAAPSKPHVKESAPPPAQPAMLPVDGMTGRIVRLPQAKTAGTMALEQLLARRRSNRRFSQRGIELEKLAQLLWAAQGTTDREGRRTAPSAGATYPLELFWIALRDEPALPRGVHHYRSKTHDLMQTIEDAPFQELAEAAYGQDFLITAPALLVIGAVYERTTDRYPVAGIGFVSMEAGHAAQNVYLQAAALSLHTVAVGAFNDREIARILNLPPDVIPLYLMPLGYPAES